MATQLPKLVYSKVIQSLKSLKQSWDEDRKENPTKVPYEIDTSLKGMIERHIREGKVYCNNRDMAVLVQWTVNYLLQKGTIVKSPYGGIYFPLPEGTVLPTKEEFTKQTMAKYDSFFGKPKDFTDE